MATNAAQQPSLDGRWKPQQEPGLILVIVECRECGLAFTFPWSDGRQPMESCEQHRG
jgi:hypothetical protein